MIFEVVSQIASVQEKPLPHAALIIDEWDDWFQFSTMYTLIVFDLEGRRRRIGSVKIGQFGMKDKQRRPEIPHTFEALDEQFFSLGQDDTYYEALNELGAEIRDEVLAALQDIPFSEPSMFDGALKERVTRTSLLRSVDKSTVNEQYRRIARGGARLSPYNFSYRLPPTRKSNQAEVDFSFEVVPNSQPPTNIHVIIGRNGVGKTHVLNAMCNALTQRSETEAFGTFTQSAPTDSSFFANLVSVTFSAFDPFEPIPSGLNKKNDLPFSYIGLKRISKPNEESLPKTPQMLSTEFTKSAKICRQGARASRWARALRTLESDPIFKEAQIASLAPTEDDDGTEQTSPVARVFSRLSSGHKIVLLTITRLVETVAERSLVLLDEPEAHLHPPLLSALIRALSDLLIDRNGVAVIATHSPVILQEVPKSCVWKLRRSGTIMVAERPRIETFGESVGILTNEVFGLEVLESGFHKMIADTVGKSNSYEAALETFGGELGGEAKAIVRGMLAAREEEEEG